MYYLTNIYLSSFDPSFTPIPRVFSENQIFSGRQLNCRNSTAKVSGLCPGRVLKCLSSFGCLYGKQVGTYQRGDFACYGRYMETSSTKSNPLPLLHNFAAEPRADIICNKYAATKLESMLVKQVHALYNDCTFCVHKRK